METADKQLLKEFADRLLWLSGAASGVLQAPQTIDMKLWDVLAVERDEALSLLHKHKALLKECGLDLNGDCCA